VLCASDGPTADGVAVFGRCCNGMSGDFAFVLMGNDGAWSGLAPTAGDGCEVHPQRHLNGQVVGPHAMCPGVRRVDVALGAGDDLVAAHAIDAINVQPTGPITIPVPVRLDGRAGQDGLSYAGVEPATLIGGEGDDGLMLAGPGSMSGGPGDDLINLDYDHGDPVTVDCGPGNDTIRAFHYKEYAKPAIDRKSCPPVLQAIGAVPNPPPGEALAGLPVARIGRDGHLRLNVFRPTEAAHGTVRLMAARQTTPQGLPRLGTRYRSCSTAAARFRVRARQAVRVDVAIPLSIRRRAGVDRHHSVPCTFRVKGVDKQGERFHQDDFTIRVYRSK